MNNDDERDTAEEAYNRALLHDPDEARGEYGRCDTCGAPCDPDGCTVDPSHAIALDPPEPAPRVPDGGPRRAFEYSESERRDIRDAGRGHLL